MEDNKEKIQTLIVTWIIENGQTRFGLIIIIKDQLDEHNKIVSTTVTLIHPL